MSRRDFPWARHILEFCVLLPDFHLYSLSLAHSESVCIDIPSSGSTLNRSRRESLRIFWNTDRVDSRGHVLKFPTLGQVMHICMLSLY